MSITCELVNRPAQPTLSIRTRAPVQDLSQVLGKAYAEIGQYLATLGEAPAGAPYVAYYNMDMQDLDIEVGIPVSKHLASQGEIQSGQVPAGKFATCLYVGSYQDIGPAYETLTQFVAQKGYQSTGVSYEYYLNDPAVTPPEALQTQISFPLQAG